MGGVLAAATAWTAHRTRALTRDGAWATGVLGTMIFAGGGISWAIPLLVFFGTSTWWTRFARAKRTLSPPATDGTGNALEKTPAAAGTGDAPEQPPARSGGRRAVQVVANGGVAAIAALAFAWQPEAVFYVAFAGALAAATADTWATEIGSLSRSQPRLITTGAPAPTGSSGAVSLLGTGAGLLGSAVTAAAAAVVAPWALSTGYTVSNPSIDPITNVVSLFLAVTAGGLVGMLGDSLLGATVQARFRCPECLEMGDEPLCRCAAPARRVSGWAWLDNHGVNLAATLLGAVTAVLLAWNGAVAP